MDYSSGLRSGIAEAEAPIRPLAWELPYAVGLVLKRQKQKKKTKKKPQRCAKAQFTSG